jgi:carbon monoxide dehydrogenase subunit G
MSEVVEEIEIDAPVEKVWALVMDPHRLGDWVTIHRRLYDHSHGEPGVGSTMEQGMTLRGAHFKVKWKLVKCDAPHHAEWHGKGPARSHAETEYHLEDNGKGGTRFSYRNDFSAPMGPLGKAASRVLVGGLPKKEAVRTLQNLKRVLES